MDNKILARVGEFTVTESEVNGMVARMMQSGQNLDNPQGRAMVLEQLIANKLFLLDDDFSVVIKLIVSSDIGFLSI